MARQRKIPLNNRLAHRVATLFLRERKKVEDIRKILEPEFRGLTRQMIYPLLADACELGLIRFVPPVEDNFAEQLAAKYPKRGASDGGLSDLHVVYTGGPEHNDLTSAKAAAIAFDVVLELVRKGITPVGLGLGPGKATLDFSRHFSELLNRSTEPSLWGEGVLKLFAITAGCLPHLPELAPVSFFNLFPERVVESRVGLFAETLMTVKEFEDMKQRPGLQEAFDAKDQINIVVTAMGDPRDPHDLLSQFMGTGYSDLEKLGAIGNVQYRPFSETGFIREQSDERRAFTLFELDELVAIARERDRHVILIARQCGRCGMTRARVLKPLLQNDKMRVFSKLILDVPTALELLALS